MANLIKLLLGRRVINGGRVASNDMRGLITGEGGFKSLGISSKYTVE